MSTPDPAEEPASPRSPRPTITTNPTPAALGLPPGALVGMGGNVPPPPRASLSSMMFLTFLFFFMSGGSAPPPARIDENGEIQPRVTELDIARQMVTEFKGWINGTGNWTEVVPPALASALLPPQYRHGASSAHFYPNITGFHRDASLTALDYNNSQTTHKRPHRVSEFNETIASELVGDFAWTRSLTWDVNMKERDILDGFDPTDMALQPVDDFSDWHWVKGGLTVTADGGSVDYDFYGLHHVPNGTYELVARPQGVRIDIRELPVLYPQHHNETTRMILARLEKELKVQEESLIQLDASPDAIPRTSCRLQIHLALPPMPPYTSLSEIALYESEMRSPTGLRSSLKRPPAYWQGAGLGGVMLSEECGFAFLISGGKGVGIDDFWRKSINYAAFATVSQLLILCLLVRQMESTRTPSTLAKVSLWTIVLMGVSDSWVFSAHVVVGIMSNNKSSLPMLLPGFLSLCTAIVFGPRYAVLLHRIQAPEHASSVPSPLPVVPGQDSDGTSEDGPSGAAATDHADETTTRTSVLSGVTRLFAEHPFLKSAVGMFVLFQVAFLPSVVPFFLFAIYSSWLPQIWRNARRGTSGALLWSFVIGTSCGRLALPLYAFGCPENVLFVKPSPWVWVLVLWQFLQITILYAQERFGPSFFTQSYNYHPLLPPSDAENPATESTCSICMEEVDTRPGPSTEAGALLGLGNARRSYAMAPCHHLFHTKCLAQWLAIKFTSFVA